MKYLRDITFAAAVVGAMFAGGAANAAILLGPPGPCSADGCDAPPAVISLLASYDQYDFNSGLPIGYAGTGNLATGLTPGISAPPLGDTSQYLTVPLGGVETFTPGGVHNVFGLYWGSVNSYNTIILSDGPNQFSFTGTDLFGLCADGSQVNSCSNQYVTFLGIPFTSVTLELSQYAFESDNHLIGDLPEPGPLALIGVALLSLLGLGATSRRRRA